ncbi:MAG TPA: response regulator transcription factor [Tepidisphaeraceae bacterium]
MRTATKQHTVVLVDDHPLLRRGVAEVINVEDDLRVVGEAGTMQEAFKLTAEHKPDVIVVDVSLDGNNGLELMKQLVFRDSELRMLAYSMHDEQIYAERALRAGAKGYLMKQEPPEVLKNAIRTVLKGKIFLSQQMSDRLLGKLVGAGNGQAVSASPVETLSDRELEVLHLLGQGMTTSKIADKLCLSVKTVETYREHLKQKLHLQSGPELLRYAIEWSLSQTQ